MNAIDWGLMRGALVARMPAFRHPPAALVRQVIAEASSVARHALRALGRKSDVHA